MVFSQQELFTHQQVTERCQPVIVLGNSLIADLAETKALLDLPERILNFGTIRVFDSFGFQFDGIQRLSAARPFGNAPGDMFQVHLLIPIPDTGDATFTQHQDLCSGSVYSPH
jgi:hypothetical protein